ncbi:MAG: hypothetical protein O2967_13165 [Proteobacteria bacterium]|nr:hypothetical protein [Pseudomonadota bacterium]
MIDDIGKTMALTAKVQAALPMAAFATDHLRSALQQQSDKVFPRACSITEIRYMNDEGGIACHLDFGFSGTQNVYVVSITHLRFGRGNPLRREIEAYCKHRIKQLKKLDRGRASI